MSKMIQPTVSPADAECDHPVREQAAHTPTPWEYRPHRHDDWGWIRAPKLENGELSPLVAIAKSGAWLHDAELNEHRLNKTDPYAANAAFIVKAVNSHDALVKALRTAIRVASEAREEWDRAPSGMKAGKLLIALIDPSLKYRADITEMHAAIKLATGDGTKVLVDGNHGEASSVTP